MLQLITLMSGIMSFLLKEQSWCVISCSAFNYLWKATGEQLQVWYRSRTSPSTAVFQAVLATLRMQTQIITFLLFLVMCLSVGSLKLLTGVCAFCCCSVVSFLYLCNLNKKRSSAFCLLTCIMLCLPFLHSQTHYSPQYLGYSDLLPCYPPPPL